MVTVYNTISTFPVIGDKPARVSGVDMFHETIRERKKALFIEQEVANCSPVKCEFIRGDIVLVTNDYGVEFPGQKIIGFVPEIDPNFRPESYVYLDWDCYWFAVSPSELRFENREDSNVLTPEELTLLWDHFGEAAVDTDDCLENAWRHFPAGTHRESVWQWFDNQHPNVSVVELMGLVEG